MPLYSFTDLEMWPAATIFAVGAAYMVLIKWRKGPKKPKCCWAASREIMAMSLVVSDLACSRTVRWV